MQRKVKKVSYRRCISIDTFPIQIHCSQIKSKDTKNVSRYVSGRYSIRYSHTLMREQYEEEKTMFSCGTMFTSGAKLPLAKQSN